MLAQEACHDFFAPVVREQSSREGAVLGAPALGRVGLGEHRQEVGFGARLQLAGGGNLLLDWSDLVREPQEVEPADVVWSDERNRSARATSTPRTPGSVHVRFDL